MRKGQAVERGAVDVALVSLVGGSLVVASVVGACVLLRGVSRGLTLLDDERGALVCRAAPDRMPVSGLPVVAAPSAGAGAQAVVPCLPRRLDYAAPGRPQRAAPEAFCTLLRKAGLPAVVGDRSCP